MLDYDYETTCTFTCTLTFTFVIINSLTHIGLRAVAAGRHAPDTDRASHSIADRRAVCW